MAVIATSTSYLGETYGAEGGLILDEFGPVCGLAAAYVVHETADAARIVVVVAEGAYVDEVE